MRERKEKVNPPREIPSTSEDYLSPPGVARFLHSLLVSSLLAFPTVESLSPAAFSTFEPAVSERRAHGSLKILYFIVTARSSGSRSRYRRSVVSARLSNGRFEFA